MGELNEILAHLQGVLGALSGAPVELDGAIMSRNLRVMLGDAEYVLRQPGKDTRLLGIDRESERLASEAAAAVGIGPGVAAMYEGCLVTRFVASRALDAQALSENVEEIARALRRFHDSPTLLPSRFSVPNLLADYSAIVRERGGTLPDAYAHAQAATARIAAALPIGAGRPCHNDLLAANFIRADASSPKGDASPASSPASPRDGDGDDGRLLIVAWEYAGMGDPRFDLGNLSVNNDFDDDADERLLSAYHGRLPTPGERAALKLMRVLSDAREGAWGVVQAHISELDFDFDGYAREHFARMSGAIERPEFEQWLATARTQAPTGASAPAGAKEPLFDPKGERVRG